MFGSGPAVGTVGAADYVPYTTYLGAFRSVGGQFVFYGNTGIQFRSLGQVYLEAASTMTFASTGALTFDTASTITARTLSYTLRTPGNFDWSISAPTKDTRLWEATGYAGRETKSFYYGTTNSTSATFLTGRYTPAIANGVIVIETVLRGSTASGATGYARKFVTSFKIAAGVMGANGSPSIDWTFTTLATPPTVTQLSFDAGNTQFGVSVTAGDTTLTRWEATCVVHYVAAA